VNIKGVYNRINAIPTYKNNDGAILNMVSAAATWLVFPNASCLFDE
jgi:hypothetical protein